MVDRSKILHIINGLHTGGAEMMLHRLLSATDCSQFEPMVISLRDRGTLGGPIEALGVPVYAAGMTHGWPTPVSVWRLLRTVRRLQPDLIQGWMYHGNLAASLVGWRVPVLWNVRHSLHDLRFEKRRTALLIRLGARLSSLPAAIVYNAQVSARQHETLGYKVEKRQIIPNGFECDRFRPSLQARSDLRRLVGVSDETLLIGLVARHHPMKDYATFLRAAGRLAARSSSVHFVLVGRGATRGNATLQRQIEDAGLGGRAHLLGERSEIAEIMAGLDMLTLSSAWGEGFPNVVGEAMACAVPCVVTDVGDSAWIVGDTGRVVPPQDPVALADAWSGLIDPGPGERSRLGRAARQRISAHFALPQIAEQYERLYRQVLASA